MNKLRQIISNPLGIATVIVHWLLFVYAYFVETDRHVFVPHIGEPRSMQILILIDSVSLSLSCFIWDIATIIYKSSVESQIALDVQTFLFISIQWLLIGYVISRLIERFKSKQIIFSLK